MLRAQQVASLGFRFQRHPEEFKTGTAHDVEVDPTVLTLSVVKPTPAISGVTYTVQVSPDLIQWFSAGGTTTVMSDSTTLLKVRDNTPVSGSTKRFIRLQVTSEP
ncbi:MAG: hypothetical protein EOP02_09840 [Proteobacteria bacterium]|nr:MAG: hypothetical protein EOP02_09840 [Pseudomonadota bacterium]